MIKLLTGKAYAKYLEDTKKLKEYSNRISSLEREVQYLQASLQVANSEVSKLRQERSKANKIKYELELDTRKAQKKILQLSKELRHLEAEFERVTSHKV